MNNKRIAIVAGILVILVFFASSVIAREKESDEAVMQRFPDSQKARIEKILDNPAAMKEYVISQKDVNVTYSKGNTLLHYAANRGYLDIVELLLKKGADINALDNRGRTPLHEAMAYRRYDVARYLVEHGADTSLKNKDGETPLISVVYMDDKKLAADLVDFFIKRGFDVRKSADAHLLNEAIGRGHRAVALILLEKGVAFDDASLSTAAVKGYEDVFQMLLSKGADPSQKGILHAACASGNITIVKTLVEKGQQPAADDIDFALYKGSAEAAVYLNTLLKKSKGQEVDLKKRCRMKPDGGPCAALFHAGYYNQVANTCSSFIYGGCGGTVPFETIEACRRVCEELK